eukprot:scaffold26734_cov44-Phaeocystis_antarctica.AAC.1
MERGRLGAASHGLSVGEVGVCAVVEYACVHDPPRNCGLLGFRDVCRPWACACGDAHPMGQPGGACLSPPSHRTSRLRAEPRVQFW